MCQHNTIQLTLDAVIGYIPAFHLLHVLPETSWPPAPHPPLQSSCLGVNKITNYAVTRPQLPPPARKSSFPWFRSWFRSNLFLAPAGTPRTVHSHLLAISFPVGAQRQHCCAPARQAASSAAATLPSMGLPDSFSFQRLTASWNLLPLFFTRRCFVFNDLQSLCQNTGGGVPLQLLRAP
jgi:hypothetical protein